MMKVIDKEVLSSDKTHHLKGKIYLPEGEPKGFFHVVHGMTEYIGRFDRFMREMAADGYITFGYDHLGHGATVNDNSELGYFAPKDGWKLLIDDVYLFGSEVRRSMAEYDHLPFILMGHSMGSFIVRLAAAKYNHYDKLIIMGTAGPNPAADTGILLSDALKKIKGDHGYSDFIYSMAFGAYNLGFEYEQDPYAWLSVNRANRDAYREDPLCTYHFTISAMQDLVRLNKYSNEKIWYEKIDKRKPILLTSGSDDPVGEHGKGVFKVYKTLREHGADVRLRLYVGYRHEILNDFCRDDVIRDIREFVG